MAIDHPHWLFDLLCWVEGEKSELELDDKLLCISEGRIKSQDSKYLEMHIFTLTSLSLLDSRKKGKATYFRTALGDELCKVYRKPEAKTEFQSYLRSILLREPLTRPFFRKMLDFLQESEGKEEPVTYPDLKKLFRTSEGKETETVRTLYSLGIASNMIVDNEYIGISAEQKQSREIIGEDSFLEALTRAYKVLMNKDVQSGRMKIVYVPIYELRNLVLTWLGLSNLQLFDRRLTSLLDSGKGRNIHVYAAAPQWYPDRDNPEFDQRVFRYHEKIYAFLSISHLKAD